MLLVIGAKGNKVASYHRASYLLSYHPLPYSVRLHRSKFLRAVDWAVVSLHIFSAKFFNKVCEAEYDFSQ